MQLQQATPGQIRETARSLAFEGLRDDAETPLDPLDLAYAAAVAVGTAMSLYREHRDRGSTDASAADSPVLQSLRANATTLERAVGKILLTGAICSDTGPLSEQHRAYRQGRDLAALRDDFRTTAAANLPELTLAAAEGAAQGLADMLDSVSRTADADYLATLRRVIGCSDEEIGALVSARAGAWWDLSLAAARAYAAAGPPWDRP